MLVCTQVGGYFVVAAGISGLYIAFAELVNEVLFKGRVNQTHACSCAVTLLCVLSGLFPSCR